MEWLWLGQLALFGAVAFVQNMAFTWVSRSRNSGDPGYHRRAALCSNGIWFVANIMVVSYVWAALKTGSWWELVSAGVVYVLCTTEGSVTMMKRLLKTEHGKRRVGARGDDKPFPAVAARRLGHGYQPGDLDPPPTPTSVPGAHTRDTPMGREFRAPVKKEWPK